MIEDSTKSSVTMIRQLEWLRNIDLEYCIRNIDVFITQNSVSRLCPLNVGAHRRKGQWSWLAGHQSQPPSCFHLGNNFRSHTGRVLKQSRCNALLLFSSLILPDCTQQRCCLSRGGQITLSHVQASIYWE